jgi:branched-chain amino acid transport system permease protein
LIAADLAIGTVELAAIFALVNVGVILLYRTTGVLNFAQGYFMLLGAYVMAAIAPKTGYWPGLILTLVPIATLGALVYVLLMRFMINAKEFAKVITTLMLASLLAQIPPAVWGTDVEQIAPPTSAVLRLGSVHLAVADLITVGIAAAVVIVVTVWLRATVMGIRMTAQAGNPLLAAYSGIRVHRLGAIAWAVGAVLGGFAGVAYAQHTTVSLNLSSIGLSAFPAVVLGGLDSLGGTLLGGLVVSGILTVVGYFFGAVAGEIIAYGVMMATLLVFPRGFFGSTSTRRL